MDGVTDVVFRQIVDECSQPSILYTEFVPVDGLILKKPGILKMLKKHKTKTPILVQLFGNSPKLFYESIKILAPYKFSGIDINMGCPDNKVVKKGGGAALILNPKLAQEIIKSVKKGVVDFMKNSIPVSIKTRIGYHKPNTIHWISELIKTKPNIITVHGRTFDQVYSGNADWNEIKKAVDIAKNTGVKIFGNGDIKSIDQAKEYIDKYRVDGILVGRAALSNPWIFKSYVPTINEKLTIIEKHARLFNKYFPNGNFKSLRKNFIWYVKGLNNSTSLKNQLMTVNNLKELKNILKRYKYDNI